MAFACCTRLRTENEFQDVGEIANTIVREDEGRRIILADLGTVRRGYMEREVIRVTLEKTGNNKSQAAKQLGVARQTLLNKIKEYGL